MPIEADVEIQDISNSRDVEEASRRDEVTCTVTSTE